MERAVQIYAKALQESQGADVTPGTVSVERRSGTGEVRVDEIQQSREQTEADYREGRISDEEYDTAMDEYDRAEEERLGQSLEKYSLVENDNSENEHNKSGFGNYEGVSLTEDAGVYTYGFLTSQPDMTIVHLPDVNSVRGDDGRVDAAKVVSKGLKNALSVGAEKDGKVYVVNRYTGNSLRIDVNSIRHGLNGKLNRILTNARLGSVIGEIVQNAIPVNALINTADSVTGTYAMAGYATDTRGREFVAIVTVEQRTGSISDIAVYDVTHAVSGRQKRGKQVDTKSQGVYPSMLASSISIADLLVAVKSTYQSILSDDVLSALGEKRSQDGYYTNRVKYSFTDTQFEAHNQRPLEGSYTTDEVEMQARKKGYPVIQGEQIVPFRTWVQTKDRGNYGLVTGMAPENKLLVSFHNKHDGGTADNVAIAYDNLLPVPGAYQMTKEEFASLMESEPLDVDSENFSEEDMQAMEELYRQAKGSEEKAVTPIDMDKLPKRARNFLKRSQRNLLNKLCNTLGVPRSAMQEHLQGIFLPVFCVDLFIPPKQTNRLLRGYFI